MQQIRIWGWDKKQLKYILMSPKGNYQINRLIREGKRTATEDHKGYDIVSEQEQHKDRPPDSNG